MRKHWVDSIIFHQKHIFFLFTEKCGQALFRSRSGTFSHSSASACMWLDPGRCLCSDDCTQVSSESHPSYYLPKGHVVVQTCPGVDPVRQRLLRHPACIVDATQAACCLAAAPPLQLQLRRTSNGQKCIVAPAATSATSAAPAAVTSETPIITYESVLPAPKIWRS